MTIVSGKSEKEVISLCENFLLQGKIKSYSEPKKILVSLGRGKNPKPIYKYESIVIE